MESTRKITVHVPGDLLKMAQEATGLGITSTIRRGLELVAAGGAYERMRALRGRVELSVAIDELREDRG